MTTPRQVNRALAKAGFNTKIVRNLSGGSYYYFIDDGLDQVPSIYEYSLADRSTEWVVDHVRQYLSPATPAVTAEPWYVAVTGNGIPSDATVRRVLEGLGCKDVSSDGLEGTGTASVRIPEDWAKHIEQHGGYRQHLNYNGEAFVVDVDLP